MKNQKRRREILLKYVEESFNDEQKRIFNMFVEALDSNEERVLFLNPDFENGEKDRVELLLVLNYLYEEDKGDLFTIEDIVEATYGIE